MAPVAGYATLSDWIWSQEHSNHYRVLSDTNGSHKYIWPESHRPVHLTPFEEFYPSPQETSEQYSASSTYAPQSITKFKNTKPKLYELMLTGTGVGPVQSSIPYRDIPNSSRIAESKPGCYILQPTRPFRQPSPYYNMGYCDHGRCQDPYCIETQIQLYGFRDDLKHHEDQDKNGNMKDGDNVGTHSPR